MSNKTIQLILLFCCVSCSSIAQILISNSGKLLSDNMKEEIIFKIEANNPEAYYILYNSSIKQESYQSSILGLDNEIANITTEDVYQDGMGKIINRKEVEYKIPLSRENNIHYNIVKINSDYYNLYTGKLKAKAKTILKESGVDDSILSSIEQEIESSFSEITKSNTSLKNRMKIISSIFGNNIESLKEGPIAAEKTSKLILELQNAIVSLRGSDFEKKFTKFAHKKLLTEFDPNFADFTNHKIELTKNLNNLKKEISDIKLSQESLKKYIESEAIATQLVEFEKRILSLNKEVNLTSKDINQNYIQIEKILNAKIADIKKNPENAKSIKATNILEKLLKVNITLLRIGRIDKHNENVIEIKDQSELIDTKRNIIERRLSTFREIQDLNIDSELILKINNVLSSNPNQSVYDFTLTEGTKISLESSDGIRPSENIENTIVGEIFKGIGSLQSNWLQIDIPFTVTYSNSNFYTDEYFNIDKFYSSDIKPKITIKAKSINIVPPNFKTDDKNSIKPNEYEGTLTIQDKTILEQYLGYIAKGYRFNLTSGFYNTWAPEVVIEKTPSRYNSNAFLLKKTRTKWNYIIRPVLTFDIYLKKYYTNKDNTFTPFISLGIPIDKFSNIRPGYLGSGFEIAKFIQIKGGFEIGTYEDFEINSNTALDYSNFTTPALNTSTAFIRPFIGATFNFNFLKF